MKTNAELQRSPLWVADLLLLLVAVVWGTSYGVAKGALAYYPVIGFLAIRFCLTFALLCPTLWRARQGPGHAALMAGVPLGLILLAIFVCETFGVAQTHAANAAFLISLCVVFTPFAEWLILRRRPDTQTFVVAGISLLGAWLLCVGVNTAFGLGDALMLFAAVLRAIMITMTKRLTEGRVVSSLALTAVQAGVVGSGSLVIALMVLPRGLPPLPGSPEFWLGMLYLVLFCTIFAFFAQNYAVRRSRPTRVALLMGSEPVFGAIFASLWLGESLSPMAWLGGVLIVGAALWATTPLPLTKTVPATSN